MFRKFRNRSRSKQQQPLVSLRSNSLPLSPDTSQQDPSNSSRAMASDDPAPMSVFLHGSLSIDVVEARNVESKGGSFFSRLERTITSSIDGVDPYCTVKVGYNKVMQTPVITNSDCPVWNSSCTINLAHSIRGISFRVKAAKRPGPLNILSKVTILSSLIVPATQLLQSNHISGWFPLGSNVFDYTSRDFDKTPSDDEAESDDGLDDGDGDDEEEGRIARSTRNKENVRCGEIFLTLKFTPIEQMEDLSMQYVPRTYFPMRQGVNMTLYQDADCIPGSLPEIPFHPDFPHSRCWVDLANAIMDSTSLIYITGWAVWPDLVMVRTQHEDEQWHGLTLGEMLKQKAEEGVRVCVMVWDEYMSNWFSKGMMGTHDEEVMNYFRGSKVHTVKASRKNPKDGPLADLNDAVLFTHHQKTVIVSRMDGDTGKHRVEAWLGGLDLTDGRYDNQQHSLFRTLDSLHAPPDFWQACALGVSAQSGPREPWHDIHSHVTGSAAWDVLANFEGRWMRQASKSLQSKLLEFPDEEFVTLNEEEEIQDGSFNVQILRSINESSTKFAEDRHGLITRRLAATDQSIHNAYIHHIRRAKHFIYIENQYFLGSSHLWDSGQRGGFAANLIPIELAEKICAKIRAGQRFMVYLNIPLFPEGPPDSGAVQEILSHQRKTVGLITSRVANAIQEMGLDSKITDWFNVFCLVNRESEDDGKGNGGTSPMEQALSTSRRFMIYIHSKFAIFDDTVAIVGSANINSRSLDGSRDTEIAVAGWQPEHMATGCTAYEQEGEVPEGVEQNEDETMGELPKGDVAAFRAAVFSAHLGGEYMDEFEQPAALDCVWKITELAEANWRHFANDGGVLEGEGDGEEEGEGEVGGDMPHGHLAVYPYVFDNDTGDVSTKQATFPDFGDLALIKGKASLIPNLLTG